MLFNALQHLLLFCVHLNFGGKFRCWDFRRKKAL